MKRHHLILLLGFLAIAAMLQWRITRTQDQEAHLRREIASLESPANHLSPPSEEIGMNRRSGSSSRPQYQAFKPKTVDDEFLKRSESIVNPHAPEELVEAHSRMVTATANGDLGEAFRNFCLLPSDYVNSLTFARIMQAVDTPERKHSALKQAGISAEEPLFSRIVEAVAKKSDFEFNIDLLARAEFTPEKHDHALAFGLGLTSMTASAKKEAVPPAPAGLAKIVMGSSGGITGQGDGSALTVNGDSSFEVVLGVKAKK